MENVLINAKLNKLILQNEKIITLLSEGGGMVNHPMQSVPESEGLAFIIEDVRSSEWNEFSEQCQTYLPDGYSLAQNFHYVYLKMPDERCLNTGHTLPWFLMSAKLRSYEDIVEYIFEVALPRLEFENERLVSIEKLRVTRTPYFVFRYFGLHAVFDDLSSVELMSDIEFNDCNTGYLPMEVLSRLKRILELHEAMHQDVDQDIDYE